MDKYEYNLKLEEIDKLVDQGDYAEAANLADTIEWKRVRNTRTLCLISEIYEAAGRLNESKMLLVRAYRRSPVGRTVLYRLVEVTTALGQYDEAIEYYSEYVQAAPHDNNRYILQYKIYRGRGSAPDELIAILEEYLGQEYTERWAYELAALYQQAGYMQKCFAACDDLVLWFHTGKYVRKALELKKKYTSLTPRQQQIYESCLQEENPQEPVEETVLQKMDNADGEVIAATIIAQTEKEIGGEVAARKAEMEREAAQNLGMAAGLPELSQTQKIAAEVRRIQQENAAKKDQERLAQLAGDKEIQKNEIPAGSLADQEDEVKDIQVELAKSMREIIAGVVKRQDVDEADIPASVDAGRGESPRPQAQQVQRPMAGRISIDDILLSMGENKKTETESTSSGPAQDFAASEDALEAGRQTEVHKTVTEAAAESLTEQQREALLYTSNPERLLKKGNALPAYAEEETEGAAEAACTTQTADMPEAACTTRASDVPEAACTTRAAGADQADMLKAADMAQASDALEAEESEDLGKTRRAPSREELKEAAQRELLSEKTIRIPAEEISRKIAENARAVEEEVLREYRIGDSVQTAGKYAGPDRQETEYIQEGQETSGEADVYEGSGSARKDGYKATEPSYEEEYEATELSYEEKYEAAGSSDGDGYEAPESSYEDGYEESDAPYEEEEYEEEYLTLPEHLRELFSGFTEIEGLEDQIANAIIQAESKGDDRTSRSGNILIFGAHGSGKTTLAMNLAKAIAQDKGSQTMKMAKIYAADLNRKDIAATIAKIAGGTLIIEEAGDLEPNTIEQLTTAMEFRTDGLVVILEDEQQYIHELLMRHPRFTMKFTAQIYIPVYTAEELAMFGQIYANAQDYMISEEALDVLYEKISAVAANGTTAAISDVIEIVSRAIQNSNKFIRKISMGKKRYDENDYILLFSKDFR